MDDRLEHVGRYHLVRRLGRGGMADVFLARTKGLEDFQRDYAIKQILPRYVDDRRALRMFLDEARITVALQHPNIVQVFDLGESGGNFYIVMEYVDGMDLRRLLGACSQASATFPYKHTLLAITESLKGLAYAHEARAEDGSPLEIVHQDISPANIMIARSGAVKLSDFGVARAAIAKWERDPEEILGKYRYFAPELVQGALPSARSDVFAVGAVLYELITGEPLLLGADFDEVNDELQSFDPRDAMDRDLSIPQPLEPILLKALSAHPATRYAAAAEFLDDLTDHVFEDRIRISSHDLAAFVARLEATVTALGREQDDDVDLPSLTLEVLAEVPTEGPGDDEEEEVTQKRMWAFPSGAEALLFPPLPDRPVASAADLPRLVADGELGFRSLVRFDGEPWRCVAEYQKVVPEEPQGGRIARFPWLELRKHLHPAIGYSPGCLVTLWCDDEAIALSLTGGRLAGLLGTDTGGDLLELLQAHGELSQVQSMVVRYLADRDEGRAAEALVTRKLVEPQQLDAMNLDRVADMLGRTLRWGSVNLAMVPLTEPPRALSPLPFDEILADAVRLRMDARQLEDTFNDLQDKTLRRDRSGPQPLPFSLQQAEVALLESSVEGMSLRTMCDDLAWDSPTRAHRAAFLLLQFGMLTLRG